MSENYHRQLRDLQKQLLAQERGQPTSAGPPSAATSTELDEWHSTRMRSMAAGGNPVGAREHAVALQRSRNRSLRALASERLQLISRCPATIPPGGPSLTPGTVYVDGIGQTAVLGKYVTYGRRDGLTDAVLLLKKAPEELDDVSRRVRPEIIDRFGGQLCALLYRIPWFKDVDLILPTPPDPGRFAQRLYHPPTAVADALAKYSTTPTFNDVLIKTRSTLKLRDLDRDARQLELEGSMAVAEDRAFLTDDRCVLILDDIVTWGTHFREATRALRSAGVREVRFAAVSSAHGYVSRLQANV